MTVSDTRTSGRTSAATRPSLRATRIASYSPAIDAMTCTTRRSSARAFCSSRSSSATFAASDSETTGSCGRYSERAGPSRPTGATADLPCRPIARAATAASSSAASEMSSEYAKAWRSPWTARTPTPRSMENAPDLTMPSSRLQLSTREYWK